MISKIFLFLLTSLFSNIFSNYSELVMDASTGEILYKSNNLQNGKDCIYKKRFPASTTKIMSLYLLFKALKSGKVKLTTKFRVSKYASMQEPCKVWLKSGSYVTVKNIMLAMITKSANDAAVVLAEGLSKSEKNFAKEMTLQAHRIGMKRTKFYNPSGLPHPQHISCAYDMAILGREIFTKFPKFYKFFKTKIFYYNGIRYRSTNRLVGTVDGVDGIKTGYTRSARYNIVSCARRGNQRLIVVVMGANTRLFRDKRVTELFQKYFKNKLKEKEYNDILKLLFEDEIITEREDLDKIIYEQSKKNKIIKKNEKIIVKKAPTMETIIKYGNKLPSMSEIINKSKSP